MALDRTYFNTLVDETSPGSGTPVDKAMIDAIYDDIDAALGSVTPVVQTTTSTGTQNNFALTTNVSVLRCNNASLLTITGLSAGADGQQVRIVSVGAGIVSFAHQDSGSTAANRLINDAAVGKTSLAAGVGFATYVYDGTTARWRLVGHEQGASIVPAYSAGDYTAATGNWTVDSGDVIGVSYYLRGRQLTVLLNVNSTSVSATPISLSRAIPGGYQGSAAGTLIDTFLGNPGGTFGMAQLNVGASGTTIAFYSSISTAGTWGTTTNSTSVSCNVTFEVQ